MPRYIIERNFAEQLDPTKDGVESVKRINDEEGVAWIFSFLSADKRKTYCLYEAPNPEAIRAAARRNNVPCDAIIEIAGKSAPTCSASRRVERRVAPGALPDSHKSLSSCARPASLPLLREAGKVARSAGWGVESRNPSMKASR